MGDDLFGLDLGDAAGDGVIQLSWAAVGSAARAGDGAG